MSTPAHELNITTAEALLNAPADLGRCELVRGELIMMSPGKGRHGAVCARITKALANYVDANDLGIVFGSSAGYVIARDPDTVRESDISFLCKARLRDQDFDAFLEGAPDLAVEVLSPSNTIAEMREKIDDYLGAGCRVVWIVDPLRRSVVVYRREADPAILSEEDTLSAEEVLPGFSLLVREIFPTI